MPVAAAHLGTAWYSKPSSAVRAFAKKVIVPGGRRMKEHLLVLFIYPVARFIGPPIYVSIP